MQRSLTRRWFQEMRRAFPRARSKSLKRDRFSSFSDAFHFPAEMKREKRLNWPKTTKVTLPVFAAWSSGLQTAQSALALADHRRKGSESGERAPLFEREFFAFSRKKKVKTKKKSVHRRPTRARPLLRALYQAACHPFRFLFFRFDFSSGLRFRARGFRPRARFFHLRRKSALSGGEKNNFHPKPRPASSWSRGPSLARSLAPNPLSLLTTMLSLLVLPGFIEG